MTYSSTTDAIDHKPVLKVISRTLRKMKVTYLHMANMMVFANPKPPLMGSCILVMLMRGKDVYMMKVNNNRKVLARRVKSDL
ncbi:phosphatase 2C [Musa troglodytarum]|uniref:protein-serine/threonine phosphatase n=1 Tax=Musa troglodytarum TaxID=320322 RepID=A0A9E7HRJ0_9LILI|nr:phosphatase 2C [Musa troglodytarum]